MANVQIRGVPGDVHEQLKAQARSEGRSLNEHLLQQMVELARLPTLQQLARRISEKHGPYDGPSSAEFIRHDRDHVH